MPKMLLILFIIYFFSPNRDTWLGVVQMELKTRTPQQRESRLTVQKVMGTFPRDSASPEPPLALVKVLRVRQVTL